MAFDMVIDLSGCGVLLGLTSFKPGYFLSIDDYQIA